MLEEEAYATLWNLLETVPTLSDPTVSVKEEIWRFNKEWPPEDHARYGGRRVTRIRYERKGAGGSYELGPQDYAFITIGSMTADSMFVTG